MTVSIAHLFPVPAVECPSWCVAHTRSAAGDLVHLGEAVEVGRSGSSATISSPFELRLAAVGKARPGLLLDGIPASPDALLSEIDHAVRASRSRA